MAGLSLPVLPTPLLVVVIILGLVYARSRLAWRKRCLGRPLPPGPAKLPLLGNVFNVPTSKPWTAYRDMGLKYGPIMHLNVLGQSILVLNGADTITEFLEKRSANTSDRHQSPVIQLTGIYSSFAFMSYGQQWRSHRRAFWQHFNRDATLAYWPIQTAVTHEFLNLLLDEPKELVEHIRYTFSAAILKVVYGIDAMGSNDKYIIMAEEAMDPIANALVSGKFLVEHIPWLQYIPSWVPGTGWKRQFEKWRNVRYHAKTAPLEYVKRGMDEEALRESVVGKLLADLSTDSLVQYSEEEEIVKNVGTIAFEAGSDTTFSTLQAAFLALSLNPEVVKKAHSELDAVVGPHRLPEPSDQDSLVYINAIVLEALRWHTVVPLSVFHKTVDDDELQGYFVPAGTIVIPNTWACLHDPAVFPDPEVFRPERFIRDGKLDVGLRDPTAFVFGYGRRICPGRHFALMAMFLNFASVLHVFDITPARDEHGRPVTIKPAMTDGFLSYPVDCRCTIQPRSEEAAALIRSQAANGMIYRK